MTLAQRHQKFMPPSHTLISDVIFSLFCFDGEFDTDGVLLYSLRSAAHRCRLADGVFVCVAAPPCRSVLYGSNYPLSNSEHESNDEDVGTWAEAHVLLWERWLGPKLSSGPGKIN